MVTALARAAVLLVALAAVRAYAADIGYLAAPGAGAGYHTVRLSRLLGPTGSVVAEDVTRDYLMELARRIEMLKLNNVKLALGEPQDPRLPASSLDAAILVHMYHEIAQPYAFLHNLAPALKPGARVGIVD